jgi:hypothetical protein
VLSGSRPTTRPIPHASRDRAGRRF